MMQNDQLGAAASRKSAAVRREIPASSPALKMADRVSRFKWESTPIGPMADWPESLRTAVGICLASPVPTFVWWGPELINIYNDAYAPILGAKHPSSLGMPAREVWAAVWPVFADDVEAALSQGTSVVRERVRFNLQQNGLSDEMFFTYTFSPIPDGKGGIGGVFQIVTDETSRVHIESAQRLLQARTEQQQKDAELRLARWQNVIVNMTEGVILADTDGNLLDWNRAALDMYGYTRVEDVRINLTELVANVEVFEPDDGPVPFDQWPMSRLLRGDMVRNQRVRVHRTNVSPDLIVVCNGTLIRNDRGDACLALMTLHDATQETSMPAGSGDLISNRTGTRSHNGEGHGMQTAPGESSQLRNKRSADEAARAAEILLHEMHLNTGEKDFCKLLGENLVEQALDAYLKAKQNNQHFDGSCIAASLAIAMIIVHDL